jgi:hypothetical protein
VRESANEFLSELRPNERTSRRILSHLLRVPRARSSGLLGIILITPLNSGDTRGIPLPSNPDPFRPVPVPFPGLPRLPGTRVDPRYGFWFPHLATTSSQHGRFCFAWRGNVVRLRNLGDPYPRPSSHPSQSTQEIGATPAKPTRSTRTSFAFRQIPSTNC